jgi:Protein of unknown function (DUF3800)
MLTISSFFDESGKFKDHEVISFGGVVSPAQHFGDPFRNEWARCLDANGLFTLTMKEALRAHRPLSEKTPALGVDNRIAALLPFIECIKKHLMVITALAVDVKAYSALASHFLQIIGDDPAFVAFTRTLLAVLEITESEDKINLICDDEEALAMPMYHLFRRVKNVYPDAHQKLRAITFADDEWSFGLQAADLVVSLMRQEAGKRFFGVQYPYEPLFSALSDTNSKPGDTFWMISLSFVDAVMLKGLADNWVKLKPHSLEETKKPFNDMNNSGT